MRKNIIFFMLCFVNTLISMEPLSITSEMRVPLEIKKHISAQLPQWWYLQDTLECPDPVYRVIIDSHRKFLAISARQNAYIFDMKTKRCIAKFFHKNPAYDIRLSQCGTLLATARPGDGIISLFDIQTKMKITSVKCNNYESICFDSQKNLLVDRGNETYIFNKKDNSWITAPRESRNHSNDFKDCVQKDFKKVHLFNDKKEKIASFCHDKPVNSACADRSLNILITASCDHKARIFAAHTNDTLDQRMFKAALNKWILIEKPSKELTTRDMILSDVATKCFDSHLNITGNALTNIWLTFPRDMRKALWRTLHYKIQKYGKFPCKTSSSSYCSIQ